MDRSESTEATGLLLWCRTPIRRLTGDRLVSRPMTLAEKVAVARGVAPEHRAMLLASLRVTAALVGRRRW